MRDMYILYIYTHPAFARVQTLISLIGLMKDSNSTRQAKGSEGKTYIIGQL